MSRSQTEIARKMLAAGIQTEQVMEFTGLDKDAVEKLSSESLSDCTQPTL